MTPESIKFLREAFERETPESKWAAVPEYEGKHGHPILVGREMIEEFLRAPATSSARDIEHAHRDKIAYLAVDDPLVAGNVDTPEQYAALQSSLLHTS